MATTFSGTKLNFSPVILQSSTAIDYEENQEQTAQVNLGDLEYSKIGNYADVFMKPSGKNLFDKSTITDNKAILFSNGEINTDNDYISSDYIEVEPNTNYYCNYVIFGSSYYGLAYYDSSKTYISGATITNQITTPNNAKYLRFCVRKVTPNNTDINTLMLNKGTTSLPYEPYGTKWYLMKNIGKVVLNGNETWFMEASGSYATNPYFRTIYAGIPEYRANLYSNYFQVKNISASTNYAVQTINNAILLQPSNNILSINDFKTWLSTHNTIIYYPLSTPTYILLNDTLQSQLEYIYNQMLAYKGQTNISQINNDLPFIIDSTALKDLTSL